MDNVGKTESLDQLQRLDSRSPMCFELVKPAVDLAGNPTPQTITLLNDR